MIGAVILAAGRGSRLGGVAKALIERDGASFLEHIARRCQEAQVAPVVVVIGEPFAAEVGARAQELGLEVAVNPDPDRGMGSSVAAGFAHAIAEWGEATAALLWPVDHPRVAAETVAALCQRAGASVIAIPTFADRGGHPALVGRDVWPALRGCGELDGGARAVFGHNRDRVIRVAVDDPGVARDVDHPRDLDR